MSPIKKKQTQNAIKSKILSNNICASKIAAVVKKKRAHDFEIARPILVDDV